MNLYVGNLSQEITESALRQAFSEFGEVVSVKVIRDPATGEPRGFAFVEMADKGAGYDAMDNLDCAYLEGNIISVKQAKQNTGKPGNNMRKPPYPRKFNNGPAGDDSYNRI